MSARIATLAKRLIPATVTAELTDGTLPLNDFEFNWLPLGQTSTPGISSTVKRVKSIRR